MAHRTRRWTLPSPPALSILNSTISNNLGEIGGGLMFQGSSLTVSDSTFSGNIADELGQRRRWMWLMRQLMAHEPMRQVRKCDDMSYLRYSPSAVPQRS